MHIYFVRHGETAQSSAYRHQSPTTPLSPIGREHMLTTADYLRGVNPDLIITSGYVRAQESARIIGSVLGVTPLVEERLHEVVRPSKFYHTSYFNLETLVYVVFSVLFRNDPKRRYLDGENYRETMNRVRSVVARLESYATTHQSVVVVSHSIMINLMLTQMCKGQLSLKDIITTCMHIEKLRNASVVHAEYTPVLHSAVCGWNLRETVLP